MADPRKPQVVQPTASAAPAERWFSPKPTPDARLRLFCFPFAGGGTIPFLRLRESLANRADKIEVVPVLLPGRETRFSEPPYVQLERLLSPLCNALAPHLHVPFAFFGYSMGALIAFELCRELRRRGLPEPQLLIAAARRAPQFADGQMRHRMSDAELTSELGRLNGTPRVILDDPQMLQIFLPLLRADFAVCESYVYREEPPLSCPIAAFAGAADPQVDEEQLAGWSLHTRSRFGKRRFPGDHFFMSTAHAALSAAIDAELGQAFLALRMGSQRL